MTLHLVSADAAGNVLSDTPESSSPATQAQAIADLKQHLPGWLPPHVLSDAETDQALSDVTLITGQTPTATLQIAAVDGYQLALTPPDSVGYLTLSSPVLPTTPIVNGQVTLTATATTYANNPVIVPVSVVLPAGVNFVSANIQVSLDGQLETDSNGQPVIRGSYASGTWMVDVNPGEVLTLSITAAVQKIPFASPVLPFPGNYQPQQSLSAFDGEIADGKWSLIVLNDTPGAPSGAIQNWSLLVATTTQAQYQTFQSATPDPTNPAPWDSYEVTVAAGQTVTGVDFGNYQPVTIQGQKFEDVNGSGVRNANDPALNGWTIELLSGSQVIATQVTRDIDLNGDGVIEPRRRWARTRSPTCRPEPTRSTRCSSPAGCRPFPHPNLAAIPAQSWPSPQPIGRFPSRRSIRWVT